MDLDSSVEELKGVGDEVAKKLTILGVTTVGKLIDFFPRRYEDYSSVVPVNKLRPGQVTIEVTISSASSRYVRRGLHITEAIASDSTGSVRLVWFNQPYRAKAIKPDKTYFVSGEYNLRRGRFSILNPAAELASNFPVNTARIVPIYRETKGLKSATIRKLLREAIQQLDDIADRLPLWLVERNKLMSYGQAVSEMHFPSSAAALQKAKHRLGFEEIFELTLAALLNKQELTKGKALSIPFKEKLARDFVSKLPFTLTDAQRRVAWQVLRDMAKNQPMNRLIEGDVGSGKTLVAAMASLMAMEQNFQVALMAPTEILARQHARTLHRLLDPVNYADRLSLLIGAMSQSQKQNAHKSIASGLVKFIIGTHALIAERVDMHKLGLVIIDEQHRFGVEQRKKLQAKAGHMPHVLHISATPIPRSLALTLYGELDISILDEMPPGRQPVITKIVSPNSRAEFYRLIDNELAAGRQMFVVCPLISDSEVSKGLSAEEVYERLSSHEFKHHRVALLHGKMKSKEKEKTMQEFINKDHDILVTTTVIEVGVDIPNASIMLIEGPERFGLAQIHQLRGRVGRGAHQSYCYLMMSDSSQPSQRLQSLEVINDGFKLAELDLRLRGPGAIYGRLQHGALDLRVADLSDMRLIAVARAAAQQFLAGGEKLASYRLLARRVSLLRAVTNLN